MTPIGGYAGANRSWSTSITAEGNLVLFVVNDIGPLGSYRVGWIAGIRLTSSVPFTRRGVLNCVLRTTEESEEVAQILAEPNSPKCRDGACGDRECDKTR